MLTQGNLEASPLDPLKSGKIDEAKEVLRASAVDEGSARVEIHTGFVICMAAELLKTRFMFQ